MSTISPGFKHSAHPAIDFQPKESVYAMVAQPTGPHGISNHQHRAHMMSYRLNRPVTGLQLPRESQPQAPAVSPRRSIFRETSF